MILYGSRIEGHYSLNANTPQFRFNSDVQTNKQTNIQAVPTGLIWDVNTPNSHTNSHLIFTGSDACTVQQRAKAHRHRGEIVVWSWSRVKNMLQSPSGRKRLRDYPSALISLTQNSVRSAGGALMQSWLCWGTSGRLGFWPPEETSAVPGWPWSDTGPSRPCQTCLPDWANRTTGVDTQGRASSQRRGWRASGIRPAGGRATGCWWCREAWWDPERLTADRTGVDGASQPPEGLSLLSRRDR